MAICEAVRNNRAEAVSILLSHRANAKIKSKTHLRSALDWAIVLGHEAIVHTISEHVTLEERALSLFKAVTNCDTAKVEELTEGGVSFPKKSR